MAIHVGGLVTVLLLLAAGSPSLSSAQARGIPASGVVDLATDADAALVGGGSGDRAGFVVVQVGDVNGDGHMDLAVSAPRAAPLGRHAAGEVHIAFGPFAGAADLQSAPGLTLVGAAPGDQLGIAVAAAGDLNGDGLADVIVGAPGANGDAGAAYVVLGRSDPGTVDLADLSAAFDTITTSEPGAGLGTAVAGVGDVDGDHIPDLAVGSPGSAVAGADGGRVDVVFGSQTPMAVDVGALGSGGFSVIGPEGSRAGLSVAAAGDVDGDRHADILLGAPGRHASGPVRRGAAYVLRGHAETGTVALDSLPADAAWEFDGVAGDLFGVSVASAGDINADGRPDIVVGASWASPAGKKRAGSAYVLTLPPSPTTTDLSAGMTKGQGLLIEGANEGEYTGATVRGLGDLDNDGLPEVVITAPFAGALGRHEPGVAYVIHAAAALANRDDPVLATSGLGDAGFRVVGPGEGGWLFSASSTGDLDGDGAPDLLVGAVAARNGKGADAGGAYMVYSTTPAPPPPPPPHDPGVDAEAQAGCHAVSQIELLIDDSGSMADSDPGRLRARAIQLLIAKPRNVGVSLGAIEFGELADELFPPQVLVDPATDPSQSSELLHAIDKTVIADNGSTDYNAAFQAARSAAPRADARIFLTDGAHNQGPYLNGHRGGPPTYVIGLDIGRTGKDAARLRRIANETKGRYFPNATAETLQAVINVIDSRLNCDTVIDTFVQSLEDNETSSPEDVPLKPSTRSADLNVSWARRRDQIGPGTLRLLNAKGQTIQRVSARAQQAALAKSGRGSVRSGGLTIRGVRGPTFYTLRFNGIRGKTLRITTTSKRIRGKHAHVRVQVAQSRRHR